MKCIRLCKYRGSDLRTTAAVIITQPEAGWKVTLGLAYLGLPVNPGRAFTPARRWALGKRCEAESREKARERKNQLGATPYTTSELDSHRAKKSPATIGFNIDMHAQGPASLHPLDDYIYTWPDDLSPRLLTQCLERGYGKKEKRMEILDFGCTLRIRHAESSSLIPSPLQ